MLLNYIIIKWTTGPSKGRKESLAMSNQQLKVFSAEVAFLTILVMFRGRFVE
jgi:hypothetical protein